MPRPPRPRRAAGVADRIRQEPFALSTLFRHGHATHPNWRMALELALAQVEGQARDARHAGEATLGLVYVTPPFAPHLAEIADHLRTRTGLADWAGSVGHAICATGAEYVDEPAVSLMLAALPPGSARLFSGRQRLQDDAAGVLVHADPRTPDLPELIEDLAGKVGVGPVFGGLASGQADDLPQLAGEVLEGGLSGVSFDARVPLLSAVTQGCSALAGEHTVSAVDAQFMQTLDGRPALDVLLDDLGVPRRDGQALEGEALLRALPRDRLKSGLLVGFAPRDARPDGRPAAFGDWLVRNVVGIDPHRRVVAVAGEPQPGDRAVFCTRDAAAAWRDLTRLCAELREEAETRGATMRGAVYVSCVGRGGALLGGPSAELKLIESQLGPVPLTGFFANGEISGGRLFGYTGVLTVFL